MGMFPDWSPTISVFTLARAKQIRGVRLQHYGFHCPNFWNVQTSGASSPAGCVTL